jgi:hypothetical protein
MDAATRELRRRNKAMWAGRNGLSEFETRGQGRKNKPAETFATKRCEFISLAKTGTKIWIPRVRKVKGGKDERYMLPIIKGGVRCPNAALHGGMCRDHLGRSPGDDQPKKSASE